MKLAVAAAAMVASASACKEQQEGVIIGSGYISVQNKGSVGDCCDYCEATSNCAAYTYATDTKQCFLKDNIQKQKDETNRVSGLSSTHAPLWNACTQENTTSLPFCNTNLSMDDRIKDLITRFEDEEIGSLLTARQSIAIPRLGIPAYYWGTNAIHGIQNTQCVGNLCPTAFPAPVSLASSFNMSIVKDMGKVIGTELRAYYHSQNHDSLDTWSPTINVNRDPRWGRNVESPSEDPHVCGEYGVAYTEGLQNGEDPSVMPATVTLKHWAAYSLENFNGSTRYDFNAIVSEYDLTNTYFVAWEQLVKEAKAKGVMCSYNALNGKATCGNRNLTNVLTGWGFEGYITSDSDSCACIKNNHHFCNTSAEAAAICLKSGTDIDSGNTYKDNVMDALDQKLITRDDLNAALSHTFRTRFEMGMFDPNVTNPYRKIPLSAIGAPDHVAKSLHAARQSVTLLKNDGKLLPFAKGKKVAVIGTSANSTSDILGNYNGPLCPGGGSNCVPTLYDMISKVSGGVTTLNTEGSGKWTSSAIAEAVTAAKAADYVVLVASNAADGGGEGHDRYYTHLETTQYNLAKAILAAKGNQNVLLLLINGGIISIDDLVAAPAIIEGFMPGVTGAQAVAESIFGDNNPSGKMPVTMYHSTYINEVDFKNMSMETGPGRSYRYYKGTPIFKFGYGLSYTDFSLKFSSASQQSEEITVTDTTPGSVACSVTNTGRVAGAEVVFAYMNGTDGSEIKRLWGFQKVFLQPGETKQVEFSLPASKMSTIDRDGVRRQVDAKRGIILSRGHGEELFTTAHYTTSDPRVTFKIDKWW
eukprot:TRINITY_DN2245_c0_g1_i4.p1 TRINITY_DN2245_c0_g1~~TRINITY_DN2245_c0_g1_i4.p1  ORF type:complete len:826 (+),score=196.82 TRINITY_DN2245_c0_g1_i4:47-2479(+)